MIEHNPKYEKELNHEFEVWLDSCSKIDLVTIVGIETIEQIWLAKRLERIKKEIEESKCF